ncbi:hypothetical protein PanWU01x14_184440, partial [Parasponia andersonii]
LDDWVLCKLYKTLHHRSRNEEESGNGVEDIQPVEEYQSCNQVESNHQMEEILSFEQEIPQGSNTPYETESYVHNDYASAPYDNAYASSSFFSSEQQPIQPSPSDIYSSTGNLGNYGELSFYTVDATPINQCQAFFNPNHLMSNGGPRPVSYTSNPYIDYGSTPSPAIQEPIQPSLNAFHDIHNLGLDTHSGLSSNMFGATPTDPQQSSSGYNNGSPQDEELELLLSKLADHIQGVNTQQPITRLSAIFDPGPRLNSVTTNQVPHISNSET